MEHPTMEAITTTKEEQTQLEIDAFMGPHIKRARIALFIIGGLYLISTALAWSDVRELRAALEEYANAAVSSSEAAKARQLANVALYITVGFGIAGFMTMVFAAMAGTRTTFAMYGAAAIFTAVTLLQIWANGIAQLMISPLFYIVVIVIGFGVSAAWKANALRRERGVAYA